MDLEKSHKVIPLRHYYIFSQILMQYHQHYVGFDSAELLGYGTRIVGILPIFSRLNERPTS
jgi:hypothetical protein